MVPCQRCQQKTATRTLWDAHGNQLLMCDGCANHVTTGPTIHKMFLPVLLGTVLPAAQACPSCRTTLSQLHHSSLLGCPDCYRYFREPLLATIQRLQGATAHRGRRPKAREKESRRKELQRQLEEAIAQERYEDAARLRDQLREEPA